MLHKIDLEKARRKELEREREQNLLLQIFSINQGRVKQRKISLKLRRKETVHNDEKWHYHRNELNNAVIIQEENAMALLGARNSAFFYNFMFFS